jgi:hypothetical protein
LGKFPVMGMSSEHKAESSFAVLAWFFICFYEIFSHGCRFQFVFVNVCDLFLIACFVIADILFIYLVIVSWLRLILD